MAAAPATERRAGATSAAVRGTTAARRRAASGATWAAVGLVTASLPLHAAMLLGHGHGVVLTGVMAAMVLWCLRCALSLVRPAPGSAACPARSLRHLWAMALAMVLLHVVLLTGFPWSRGGHHHGGAASAVASGATAGPDAGAVLMLAVVGVELAICFACAVGLRAARGART